MLSLIVAVAENGAIGRNNELLWHISEDLKYFKSTIQGVVGDFSSMLIIFFSCVSCARGAFLNYCRRA